MVTKKERRPESWVIYRAPIKGSTEGVNAVCEQAEWEEMERSRPGVHTLLRNGIGSEAEAERLARGKSGDTVPRGAPRPAAGPARVAVE